ncbi:MAG: peroxide stress protein YaaA [Flammeovirgaceae bacterium TMED290]|nr:MAG: peroxide stress protein YaaA [Flammeovirgaceae bacterium TMED290]|tara:strand:+ start:1169 stop:1927 length:759 start_codon:yes stop_codon:yes gene_type:complete
MKILISPSKTLNFDSQIKSKFNSESRLMDETKVLHKILLKYTSNDLKNLMSVSDKIAELNFNRFKNWEDPTSSEDSRQAVYAFKGDVYSGLEADTIEEDKFDYLQNSLRIISGYYGILRPFDKILPYRLEMGTKLENENGSNLYKFWGDKITDLLNHDIEDSDIVVNLASEEYFKSVNKKKVNSKIITPVFKEFKNGSYKVIAIYAKKARGLMSRFLIDRKSNNIDDIKLFDNDGYSFDGNLSSENELVFTR